MGCGIPVLGVRLRLECRMAPGWSGGACENRNYTRSLFKLSRRIMNVRPATIWSAHVRSHGIWRTSCLPALFVS
jgi:hypothetical protein